MDFQQSLDELEHELRRRRLPDTYIARYVDELRDHITDVIEERKSDMSKDTLTDAQVAARIGDPARLAEVASVEFRRRSFCGRHRILTFLVAPMPLVVLAWIATFAAMFVCSAGVEMLSERMGAGSLSDRMSSLPIVAIVASIVFWLGVVMPPAAVTLFLCSLARRNRLSWRWSLAGCLLVALVAGMFQVVLEPASTSDGHGRLALGFGMWLFPPLQQWLQFALPLSIGIGLLWRQTHSHADCGKNPPDVMTVNRQAA